MAARVPRGGRERTLNDKTRTYCNVIVIERGRECEGGGHGGEACGGWDDTWGTCPHGGVRRLGYGRGIWEKTPGVIVINRRGRDAVART